jgi:Glycosyltransferase
MPNKKKILHLVSADCEWEAAANIASLAAGLREHGLISAITAPDHSRLWEVAEAAGVEVVDYAVTVSANPLKWMELSRKIKEGNFGLVHTHDAGAARLLSRSGFFFHPFGVVTTKYDGKHSPISAEYGSHVDAVIAPSQACANMFEKAGAREKTTVVYDGVPVPAAERALEDRHDLRVKYRENFCPGKEKPLFIVNIAPLEMESGHSAILEAMSEIVAILPQAHLLIMGEGTLADDLAKQTRITALGNDVTFLEPDKAFLRLLAAADLYVSASTNDMSGFMVQAAMATGTGVVLTPTGCYPEMIEDGKSGVFALPENEQPLKTAMLDLLESRTRREHVGRLAKARAEKLFNNTNQAALVAEIYRTVAATKGPDDTTEADGAAVE